MKINTVIFLSFAHLILNNKTKNVWKYPFLEKKEIKCKRTITEYLNVIIGSNSLVVVNEKIFESPAVIYSITPENQFKSKLYYHTLILGVLFAGLCKIRWSF